MEIKKEEFFYGNTSNASATYDMHDPVQRKAGLKVLAAMFIPIILFILPAVYLIIVEEIVFVPVVLIIAGVCFSMIATVSAIIGNKKQGVENENEESVETFKVIRSIMILIFACATYIPFLPYVLARYFAKKYPKSEFYGGSAQLFALVWSLISVFGWVIVAIIFFNIEGEMYYV